MASFFTAVTKPAKYADCRTTVYFACIRLLLVCVTIVKIPLEHHRLSFTHEGSVGVQALGKVRVAVIREEGSNGDREMAAALWSGGLEPWDITMSDLLTGQASLDSFQGFMSTLPLHCHCLLWSRLCLTEWSWAAYNQNR